MFQARKGIEELGDPALRAQYLITRGKLYGRRGNYGAARRCFEEGLDLAKQEEKPKLRCDFLLSLGRLYGSEGEYPEAINLLHEGLDVAQNRLESREVSSRFNMLLGWVYGHLGLYAEASKYLDDAFYLAKQSNARAHELISGIKLNQGWVALCLGHYSEAQKVLEEGLKEINETTTPLRGCGLLENLSAVFWNQGKMDLAKEKAEAGLVQARQAEHASRESGLLECLGRIWIEQGKYELATLVVDEGIQLAAKINHPVRICSLRQTRGWLLSEQGSKGYLSSQPAYEKAAQDLEEALKVAEKHKLRFLLCTTLLQWGELYLKQDLIDKAESAFDSALRLAREGVHLRTLEGVALFGNARVRSARGEKEARQIAVDGWELLNQSGDKQRIKVEEWLKSN